MPYYPGQHKVHCQRCGFVVLSPEARKEPDTNLIVCKDCFDPKHPQDRPIHGLGEKQRVRSLHSPEPADVFVNPGDITPEDL